MCKEHRPVEIPRLAQRVNEIGPRLGDRIVDSPGTGYAACTPLGSLLQGEQRDDVANIGVEHLLVSGVCRSADYLVRVGRPEVLDVV